MKLLIKDQSMRFRMTAEEVARLSEGEALISHTPLPSGRVLETRVQTVEECPDAGALYLDDTPDCLTLSVGKSPLRDLIASQPSRDGLTTTQSISDNAELHLSLEIDISKRQKPVA